VTDGLEIAHSQGALAWELKLASTLVEIDCRDSARNRLRDTLNRTSEGFGTRDYREAAARLGLVSLLHGRSRRAGSHTGAIKRRGGVRGACADLRRPPLQSGMAGLRPRVDIQQLAPKCRIASNGLS
jgi:hypothetical protein